MGVPADGIAVNGRIVTLDDQRPEAAAIAWLGGRIVAVGTEAEIRAYAGEDTTITDLGGNVAIPGFIDSHAHPLHKGFDDECVNLGNVTSMDELIEAIAEEARKTPAGEWVITSAAWHDDQLKERRLPTRFDLDKASDRHPISVRRGGIIMIVNSMALKLANIHKATPDPEGGTIFKDPETGEPNGILDAHSKDAIERLFPPFTHDRQVDALRRLLPRLSACGITSLRDAALLPDEMRSYQTLAKNGELDMRVDMLLYMHPAWDVERGLDIIRNFGPITGFGNAFLKLGGLKFVSDGGFEQALMSEAYCCHEGRVPADQFFGFERTDNRKMRTLMLEANRHGWQVATHCVGDKAMDKVLDIYEEANRQTPIKKLRWSIEHGIYTRPDQFERLRRLGVLLTVQPHTYVAAANMKKHWGEERAQKTYPLKSLKALGVWLGSGSDLPTTPYNPFVALQFWTTRRARNGDYIGKDQALPVTDAFRMQTCDNSFITFEEDQKGSLSVGKFADMAVLSRNPLETPLEELQTIEVKKTLVGGRLIYG